MECPRRRRAVATLIAGLLGAGGVVAQEAGLPPTGSRTPMVMPPRISPAPVTVTVSPYGGSALPPTGVPVGTPISAGIPAGAQVQSIPGPIITPAPGFAGSMPAGEIIIPAAPAPYFGYYPTQWRAFPDQPFPPPSQPVYQAPGQPLPTYPANITSPDTPPPLLRHSAPNPLPTNVRQPAKSGVVPTVGFPMLQQTGAPPPPLLPSEELKGPELSVTETHLAATLATLGRPRLSSVPEPQPAAPVIPPPMIPAPVIPAPMTLPTIVPASAIEIPFVPAPVVPTPVPAGFAADQPSDETPRVRPPVR